jgi:RND family efflux transporter MFP subunit
MNKPRRNFLAWLHVVLKVVPMILGVAGLALVIAWVSGMFVEKIPPGEVGTTARQLENQPTDVVHEVTKDYIEEAVGTLKAASRSVISSKILATIEQIHVSAGDFVNEGDLLVTLNTRELDARLSQAREVLSGAQAATREAEGDFERNKRLAEANAISQREFDESDRQLKVASANERRAQQAVTEAEVLLSYSRITAPKAGRIVDRTAEPGDTAQPGKPILTLYDSQSLRLETPVLEQLAVKLQVGQKLNVRVDSVNRDFIATVDEIVPQADAASRSFLVKASLPRSEDLYEGMFGRLQIPAGSRRHLCLATDSIRRIGQLEFVDVVLKDGTLQRRLIKTGRLGMPNRIEVLSGLEPGDQVVLYPDSQTRQNSQSGRENPALEPAPSVQPATGGEIR